MIFDDYYSPKNTVVKFSTKVLEDKQPIFPKMYPKIMGKSYKRINVLDKNVINIEKIQKKLTSIGSTGVMTDALILSEVFLELTSPVFPAAFRRTASISLEVWKA